MTVMGGTFHCDQLILPVFSEPLGIPIYLFLFRTKWNQSVHKFVQVLQFPSYQ